jgi:hypothetical protein
MTDETAEMCIYLKRKFFVENYLAAAICTQQEVETLTDIKQPSSCKSPIKQDIELHYKDGQSKLKTNLP